MESKEKKSKFERKGLISTVENRPSNCWRNECAKPSRALELETRPAEVEPSACEPADFDPGLSIVHYQADAEWDSFITCITQRACHH